MKFSSMRYFLTVVQEMNISKAAQKLYITQQSLSEHIARLESEYNVRLFERTPRLQLTYAGEQMADFARMVLNLERQFTNEMADASLTNKGVLSVGIRGSFSRIFLPQLLASFLELHPNIRLHVAANNSRILAQLLVSGQMDLCIGSTRLMSHPNFISTALPTDHYRIIIPENIMLKTFNLTDEQVRQGAAIDYRKLANVPLLLIQGDSITRSAADYFLSQHGVFSPHILLESNNTEACMAACAHGLGVTFSTGRTFLHFIRNASAKYPLYGFPVDTPTLSPDTVISYYRGRPLSRAGQDFITLVQKIISETA